MNPGKRKKAGMDLLRWCAENPERKRFLVRMAEAIKSAHSENPRSWAITTTGSAVRLHVGRLYSMSLNQGDVSFCLLPEYVPKGWLGGERFEVFPGRSFRWNLEEALERLDEIGNAQDKTLREQAKLAKKVYLWHLHQQGVVDFLNQGLGCDLPPPGYISPPLPPPTSRKELAEILKELESAKLHFPRELLANYLLALRTKRFAILTGISGTGKTQIAMAVSKALGGEERGVVVPVRPDWVDNRGLLGYLNPLTGEYAVTPLLKLLLAARQEEERATDEEPPPPFFVILDEMNLARVEHYFSDFLSALESGEGIPLHDSRKVEAGESGPQVPRELCVPGNIFFTGTVNVDETTYMFSPKVLDRAFTIEFNRVDLRAFGSEEAVDGSDGAAKKPGLGLAAADSRLRLTPHKKPDRDHWVAFRELARGRYRDRLLDLHGMLEDDHRHFGYRVANEIARFVTLAKEWDGKEGLGPAFDLAVLQKVLPKLHGTQGELERILERMFHFAVYGSRPSTAGRARADRADWRVTNGHLERVPASGSSGDAGSPTEADPDADVVLPRTGAKIWRMLKLLEQRGFTSFIE